jgi:lipopolysaccharide export system permease protein
MLSDRINRIKRIDLYLGRNTLQGVFLMLAGLVFLFSFFELLAQLNDVGKGQFRMADAFLYAALTIPRKAVTLMPLSALLGSTVALGMMADHQELTAMQAAGISVRRISIAVVGTSLILMVLAILMSEFVAPPLDQYARSQRSEARYGKTVLMSKSGFWIRQGQFIIHVGGTHLKQLATDVEIFEMNPAGHVREFIFARTATIHRDQNWLLEGVTRKVIEGDVIFDEQIDQYHFERFLTPDQLQIFNLPAESLSLTDLYSYAKGLKARRQNAAAYEHAFWQKICQPATISVMVLLSLTFIFGSIRARSAGKRIAIGVIVGIIFYLLNQILGHIGLQYGLPPILTTLPPVLLILLFALRQLKRTP